MFVISLLHQGFNAYADQLNQAAQREWEKVAGRFEEIVFSQPLEQIANVIASALNVNSQEIPKSHRHAIEKAMEKARLLGWFGTASPTALSDLAARLYPLHPTILPVLIRTFRRFGQNERSLLVSYFQLNHLDCRRFPRTALTTASCTGCITFSITCEPTLVTGWPSRASAVIGALLIQSLKASRQRMNSTSRF